LIQNNVSIETIYFPSTFFGLERFALAAAIATATNLAVAVTGALAFALASAHAAAIAAAIAAAVTNARALTSTLATAVTALSPQPSLPAAPLPLPALPPAPPPLSQLPLSACTHALNSTLTFKVVSVADAAITIAAPLPPLNADADAAVTASLVIAVIHCCPCHLQLIVESAIFPHCPYLAAASLLPLVAAIEYHSSLPWS
jgi:hypothetical protein